jgi:hypothetical protein
MATKAPLASLYAEDAEEERLVGEIKDTYSKLRGALDNRKQLFDPVLLAMAQGFLAPTKTGSFGESIGNVAALVGPAQEAETKRETELAKMRLELAQGELGMRQAARGEQEFRRILGGQPPGAPGAADEFVETPGGFSVLKSELPGAARAPAGAPGAPGAAAGAAQLPPGRQQAEGAPPGFTNITPRDIAMLASRPGMEGRAKILSDMLRAEQDRYAIAMNGTVFDKATKQYVDIPVPGQKQEDFETPYGTFRMLPYEYSQFVKAAEAGQGEEWMKNWRAGKAGAPGRRTVQQIAAEQQAATTAATKTAEAETGRTQSAIERAEDVTGRLAQYRALDSIAARKDAKDIFGIFNRPDFGSFVANLISENLKTPGAGNTISVPALENAFRNLGLPQETINKYQTALSIMATIQLQQAKLAAGQGSVSNFERQLFADASISPRDNPETIRNKVAMLKARAEFDRDIAKELRRSKMSLDDFKDKNEAQYQRMVDTYLDRVTSIAMSAGVKPQGRAGQQQPATPGAYGASRDKLREELGL